MKNIMQCIVVLVGILFVSIAVAADKVVVVPLNSSKINNRQTLIYNKFSAQYIKVAGQEGLYLTNNCVSNSVADYPIFIPLTLPLGAKIISTSVSIFDGSPGDSYNIYLVKDTVGSSGISDTIISSATGGAGSIVTVDVDLTPGTEEIVDDGETFYLQFITETPDANGFCQAQVTIELPK